MTFSEMKQEYDQFLSYNNFITMNEAKELEYIPKSLARSFPDYCECGSEMLISRDRQRPQCCNPFCRVKQGHMLAELFRRFGYKGLGNQKCKKIFELSEKLLRRNSYIEILFMDRDTLPFTIADSNIGIDFICAKTFLVSRPITFPKMVAKLGLPKLDEFMTNKLMEGMSSASELVNAINKEGDVFRFCVRRGVKDVMTIFWLNNSLVHILFADQFFRHVMRPQGLMKLPVCITGAVYLDGRKITKEVFLNVCNQASVTSDGVQLLEIYKNEAVNTNQYIIASGPSSNSKYLVGVRREQQLDSLRELGVDAPKVLITPNEFLQVIKDRTATWEQAMKNQLDNKEDVSDSPVTLSVF